MLQRAEDGGATADAEHYDSKDPEDQARHEGTPKGKESDPEGVRHSYGNRRRLYMSARRYLVLEGWVRRLCRLR